MSPVFISAFDAGMIKDCCMIEIPSFVKSYRFFPACLGISWHFGYERG